MCKDPLGEKIENRSLMLSPFGVKAFGINRSEFINTLIVIASIISQPF